MIPPFTSIDFRKVENVANLELDEVVSQIHSTLNYLVANKPILIETNPRCKGIIRGNVTDIEQVLVNLVSNSVDAIQGDGKIFILDLKDCVRIRTGENGNEAIG
jgi:nitrogen regulatory protein PII